MIFRTLVENLIREPGDSLTVRSLTRELEHDLIAAFEISRPLMEKYTDDFWQSRSYLDFLIRISKLPSFREYCPRETEIFPRDKSNRRDLELKEQLDKEILKNENLQSDIINFRKKLEACELDLCKKRSEFDSLHEQLREEKSKNRKTDILEHRLDSFESDLYKKSIHSDKSREFENLKDELCTLKGKLKVCESDLDNRNSQVDQTFYELKSTQTQLHSVRLELEACKDKKISLQKKMATLEEDHKSMMDDLKLRCSLEIERRDRSWKQLYQELNTIITNLTKVNEELTREIKRLDQEKTDQELLTKYPDLSEEKKALLARYEELVARDKMEITSEEFGFAEKLQLCQKELDKCVSELSESKKEVQERENEIALLKVDLENCHDKLDDWEKNMQHIQFNFTSRLQECNESWQRRYQSLYASYAEHVTHSNNLMHIMEQENFHMSQHLLDKHRTLSQMNEELMNLNQQLLSQKSGNTVEMDRKPNAEDIEMKPIEIDIKPEIVNMDFTPTHLKVESPVQDTEVDIKPSIVAIDSKPTNVKVEPSDTNLQQVERKCISAPKFNDDDDDDMSSIVSVAECDTKNIFYIDSHILDTLQDAYSKKQDRSKEDEDDWQEEARRQLPHDLNLLKILKEQLEKLKPEANYINVPPEEFADHVLALYRTAPQHLRSLTDIAEAASLDGIDNVVPEIKMHLAFIHQLYALFPEKDARAWMENFLQQSKELRNHFGNLNEWLYLHAECKKLAEHFQINLNSRTFSNDVLKSKKITDCEALKHYLLRYFGVGIPSIKSLNQRILQMLQTKGLTKTFEEQIGVYREHIQRTANQAFELQIQEFRQLTSQWEKFYNSLLKMFNFDSNLTRDTFTSKMEQMKKQVDECDPKILEMKQQIDECESKILEMQKQRDECDFELTHWDTLYRDWLKILQMQINTPKDSFTKKLKRYASKRIWSEEEIEKKPREDSTYTFLEMQNLFHALYKEYFKFKYNYYSDIIPKDTEIIEQLKKKLEILRQLRVKSRPNDLLSILFYYVELDLEGFTRETGLFSELVSMNDLLTTTLKTTEDYLNDLLQTYTDVPETDDSAEEKRRGSERVLRRNRLKDSRDKPYKI